MDGPFLNAGIFYVQHVARGDATAWALQELNRRIGRLTYHPESVAALPHSSWARAPYFANADEQAAQGCHRLLLLATACRVPRAACRVPRAACRLPPATCHLPPATCYLLPAACHLLPATYLLRAQAIFNDVIASGLLAQPTHAGVEMSEPRFKARHALDVYTPTPTPTPTPTHLHLRAHARAHAHAHAHAHAR